jgi:hypothetical protein
VSSRCPLFIQYLPNCCITATGVQDHSGIGNSSIPELSPRELATRFTDTNSPGSPIPTAQVLNAIALREALCRFRMRQGRVELFERPVYFAAGDHQGWTNTDGVVVGILAQEPATAQRVAVAHPQAGGAAPA